MAGSRSMFEQARQAAPAPATALYYALMTRSLSVGESEDFTARLRTPGAVSAGHPGQRPPEGTNAVAG